MVGGGGSHTHAHSSIIGGHSHGVNHGSATSPVSARSAGGSVKRKRSGAEFESSPGSGGEHDHGHHDEHDDDEDRRRQPGVKRACNECRQQKVS